MAKKRQPSQQMIETTYLIKSKNIFKNELQKRIEIGEELLKKPIQNNNDFFNLKNDFSQWNDYNLEFLKQSFSIEYNEYRKNYEDAGVWSGIRVSTIGGSGPSLQQEINKFVSKFKIKIDSLIKLLQKTDLLKSNIPEVPVEIIKEKEFDKTQVFIVHGHDNLAKEETARFIEKLGLKPIILHEKASSGKTIIEKIEEYSNVGFGIVLYTPCDVGYKKGDEGNLKSRARQNVVFEHGYLIGKIKRENVCALVKGDIETPNDISGVVYISMNSDWKLSLAKELINSGYDFDASLVLK
jgi:predicted nucleotide-binding protein